MPRFFRLKEILGDRKAGIPPIIPVSRASWYAGIKSGIYPAPVHLSERTVAWTEQSIDELCERLAANCKDQPKSL